MSTRISTSTIKTNEYNPFTVSITTTDIIQITGVVEKKDLDVKKLEKVKPVTNSLKIKKSY